METQEQYTDVIKMRGSIRMVLGDPDGNKIKEQLFENLLVTVGRAWVLGQLESVNIVTSQTIGFLAIGSGTNAPTTADTGLNNEVTRIAIGTFSTTGLTNNPPSWQAQVSFATNQGNTTLAEVGLFNSTAGGTMLAHATFASFVKATSNTLNISYTISG
jgi:Phage tail-collar fibre protein